MSIALLCRHHRRSSMSILTHKLQNIAEDWLGGSDCYRMIYLFYVLGGLWMVKARHIENRKNNFGFILFAKYLAAFAVILCFISFVYDAYLWRQNVEKLTYSLGVSIYFIVAMLRFLILIVRKNELEDMLDVINNNFFLENVGKSPRDLIILKSGERQFTQILNVFKWLSVLGVGTKIATHIVVEKSLLIPFPYIDKMETPVYEIMFVSEALIFIHFVFVSIAHGMVICGVLIRVLHHFIILSDHLSDVGDVFLTNFKSAGEKNDSEITKWRQDRAFGLIKKSIIHHQEILKIIKRTNYLLQESFFFQIFGGGLLLVDLFFHVTTQTSGSLLKILCQSVYSIAALLDITILCYYGSEIQTKSHDAAQTLYSTSWLEMNIKNRKTLRYFQMALWKHPAVKGGLMSINLNMYLKFLNYIYSFLTFMQNTLRRNE